MVFVPLSKYSSPISSYNILLVLSALKSVNPSTSVKEGSGPYSASLSSKRVTEEISKESKAT